MVRSGPDEEPAAEGRVLDPIPEFRSALTSDF